MPSRRTLLASAVAALGAGCVGASEDGRPRRSRDAAVENASNDTAEGGAATGGTTYYVFVERVDASRVYAEAGVAPLEDQPESVRAAVREAAAGGYETDEVPATLAALVARWDRVRLDGRVYDLTAAFPEYVVDLSPVAAREADDDATVGPSTYRGSAVAVEAVETAARRGEYRATWLPRYLRDLIDRYDYVETDDGTGLAFEWSLSVDRGDGPPYTLRATPVAPDDVDLPATDYASLSADAVREFERARSDYYELQESPALLDLLDAPRYVREGDEFYRIGVTVREAAAAGGTDAGSNDTSG